MSADIAFEVGRLFQPIKAIADVLTTSQKDVFVRLPGLERYFPCGIRNAGGQLVDHGAPAGLLNEVGVCPTGYDGNPFVHLGNGINYFNGGGAGITGTETYIDATINGLTVGCWLSIDGFGAGNSGVVSKDGAATDRGYSLFFTNAGVPGFAVSGNGSSTVSASGVAVSLGSWAFLCGRFTPSAEVAIFTNAVKNTTVVAVPASINVSTQQFEIGRFFNADSTIAHARVRDVFLCAAALPDELISDIRLTSAP